MLRVQIKSFIVLAVSRRSVQRVSRARVHVMRQGNTAPFEEISQRGEPLATLCPI